MKVKYYLRGLGIGIILTTLLLTLGSPKEKLSDQEVIDRAEKLGMVMKEENPDLEQILKEINPSASPAGASVTPSPESSPVPTAEPTLTPTQAPTPEPTTAPTPQPTAVPTEEPVQPTIEPTPSIAGSGTPETDKGQSGTSEITFTVKSGMSSGMVSELLKEVGLVDDADDFNNYIEKSGKASIIRVGTYTMPKGSSYKEIVTKITTKQ